MIYNGENLFCCVCGSGKVKPWTVIPMDTDGHNLLVAGGVLSIKGHVCNCGEASYIDAFGTLQHATWTSNPTGKEEYEKIPE